MRSVSMILRLHHRCIIAPSVFISEEYQLFVTKIIIGHQICAKYQRAKQLVLCPVIQPKEYTRTNFSIVN